MWRTIQAQGFSVALKDYFHRPNFLWTPAASPAIHAIDRFVLLRFLFVFLVSVGLCSGFPHNSSLVLRLLSVAGFSVYLLTSNTESCDEDVGSCDEDVEEAGEDEVEELRRQARDNEWYAVRCIAIDFLSMFGETWFLTAGMVVGISQSFQRERTGTVPPRSITVTNKTNSLKYTVASSLVCTSPLAVITVVGFFEILMVSNSSFLLTICRLAPESTTNSLSSGSFIDVTSNTHTSEGEWNVVLSFSLRL